MEILDQTEVDALLNSAGEGASTESARPAATVSASTERDDPGRPLPELPDHLKLVALRAQIERINPVRIPVTVRLAEREMPISQILRLSVGTIIEFDRPADSELDLVANNKPIGSGNAVKCGETFGLRVIKIEPWARRIMAMGLYR